MFWLKFVLFTLFGRSVLGADDCGVRIPITQQLVSFGNASRLGEWPWHVALFHRMNRASPTYACGGTIVAKNYVVTAAHCTYPQSRARPLKIAEMLIRAGIANLQALEHSLQQVGVVEIVRHDEFNSDTVESDVALLRTAGEFEFGSYVKPICLWSGVDDEKEVVGKVGTIAGWGRDENQQLPDNLKHAGMPIVSRKTCRDSDPLYYTRYLYDRKTFCAGFRNGTSPGLGDSGGGLYLEVGGKWILRGIVSNGKVVAETRLLDTSNFIVFTDVAYFMPWIKQKLNIVDDLPGTTPLQDFSVCGKKKEPQFKRTGFKEERKWPWHGEVYRNNTTRLGEVAVISNYFMLSPAEVYDEVDVQHAAQLMVKFKVFKDGRSQVFLEQRIQRIIRHEKLQRDTRLNNIALLELKAPLKFTELIHPVCLWGGDPAGWTLSRVRGYLDDYDQEIYGEETCRRIYNVPEEALGGRGFCYQISTYGFSGMLGDLLFLKHGESWYLRGITYSLIKEQSVFEILLADVAHYKSWIDKNAVVKSTDLLDVGKCSQTSYSQWMYQIKSSYQFQCYASLISPTLLVTTASCVDGLPLESLKIVNDHFGTIATAGKIHVHPSFNNLLLSNNIALIQLAQPLPKQPICLPKATLKPSQLPLQSVSWQSAYSRANPVAFHVANFTTTNVGGCADRWRREGAQVDTAGGHICGQMVGIEQGFWFYCESNLHGAPLVYRVGEEVLLRGVLDIGKANHCARDDLPEVYVDLLHYADWIVEVGVGEIGLSVVPVPEGRVEWRRQKGD
ncbi:transmembrane protease serine 9 [Culex quinquefasciatus]|uniref:transmembrane protease serine 9 n=1 Tax=Culex quinquefasciatus TaxID=7176 RepID=UPI0018E31FC6|nr:transmembrane protease serine 9 [Culex quinquefasciatus]